jgi:hypothetical protein
MATVHVDPLLSIEEFTQCQHGYLTIIDNLPPEHYSGRRADIATHHVTLCELRH